MELQNVFTAVFNMAVTGSIVILCVLAARVLLKKAPRVFSWALWLVVLFRLLCPVTLTGPVSVLEIVDAPEPKANVGAVEYVAPPKPQTNAVVMIPGQTGTPGQIVTEPVPEVPQWRMYAAWIWLAGAGGLAGYGGISYVNLKKKMRASMALAWGIRESDRISTPFVLGLLKPVIYLPVGLEGQGHILLHEQLHIRHGDHIVKALFWLAVSLHWFNPLVWLAFTLCGRDMELRCDEAVLRELGSQVRSDYAQSLLNLAAGRRYAPAPLAFGEGDTGKRVKFVLKWRKAKLWLAIPAAVLCAAVLVMTACNPAGSRDTPFGHSYKATMIVTSTQHEEPINQNQLFTLTSDMALFIRNNGKTAMAGSFKMLESLPDTCAACPNREEWVRLKAESVSSWEAIQNGPDNYLLIQMMDGKLYLIQGDQMYHLERTDLLGVSIKQPGIEAYVEPVWYSTDSWAWMPGDMSTTLVDADAKLVLMPEQDVDMIEVREEYYMRTDGETSIINTEHILKPDKNGDFLLDVSRRGTHGDDFAVYWVTVGDDRYVFRLAFPAVPGETSVAVSVPEQTREVRYSEGNVWIALQLPESWDYDITYLDDPELDAAISAGITFWPRGREEGKLFFGYYPDRFAVCGTGLETSGLFLAGQNASMGTYDGRSLWDFISFGEYFAVWGQGHEHWWAEYGDRAMEILDAAAFSTQGIDLSDLTDVDWDCTLPVSPTE